MLTACGGSSVITKKYDQANESTDLEAAIKERQLDDTQQQKVSNYVSMANNESKTAELLEEKTYGEIIDDAMAYEPVEEAVEEAPESVPTDSTAVESEEEQSAQ